MENMRDVMVVRAIQVFLICQQCSWQYNPAINKEQKYTGNSFVSGIDKSFHVHVYIISSLFTYSYLLFGKTLYGFKILFGSNNPLIPFIIFTASFGLL